MSIMNLEIKKKYVIPQMLVIKCEHNGSLLQGSSEEPSDDKDFGGPFGMNDGETYVEHV